MLTCLCDAFFGEVGIATVKVLEKAGCEVDFPMGQTCCGQPPFNAGDWDDARRVAAHCHSVFVGDVPVVVPSGSCTAMIRDGYPQCGSIAFPAFELSEFLVKQLGLTTWPAIKPYPKKVAHHRACHGRALGLTNEQETLLASIPGVDLVPLEHPEQCCGFGGAFSVTHGKLSSEIGLEKLHKAVESGAAELVSGDMGCLMHLGGLVERHSIPIRLRHFAEILAEVIE
jgi:L-lactate dehydrogenase complex protein LldE